MAELIPFLRLMVARRRRLLLGSVLLLATTAAGIGLLGLSGWFITATALTAALWSAGAVVAFDIYVPGAGIRFFALARTVARYLERLHNHDTVLRLLASLRKRVFASLAVLDVATLARLRSAEVLNRLTADIDALDELYLRALMPPLVAGLGIAGVGVMLTFLAPVLGITLVVWLTFALVLLCVLAWRTGGASSEAAVTAVEQLRLRVLDLLDGLAEHAAFGSLDDQRHAIAVRDAELGVRQRRAERTAAFGEAASEWAVQVAAMALLLLGLSLYRQAAIGGAAAVFAALAVLGLGEILSGLPRAFVGLGRSRMAALRLNRQMALRPAVAAPADPVRPERGGALVLERVSFRHEPIQPWVLDAVSLSLCPGQRVAVTGPSGCGKSTLAELLVRLRDPVQGRICLAGVDLRQLDPAALRRRVGYLTQHTELFDATLAWNLRIAAPAATPAQLWRALEVAGLASAVDALPMGMDTPVGETGLRLSGGQARRLALARVVLLEPDIVVLDEPLRGLDADTAAMVSVGLDRWLGGRGAVLLSHDTNALPAVDRTLSLRAGALVEDTP